MRHALAVAVSSAVAPALLPCKRASGRHETTYGLELVLLIAAYLVVGGRLRSTLLMDRRTNLRIAWSLAFGFEVSLVIVGLVLGYGQREIANEVQ